VEAVEDIFERKKIILKREFLDIFILAAAGGWELSGNRNCWLNRVEVGDE
jgi:hypothetical protein